MDNGRSADPLLTTEPDVIDLRSDTVTQPGAEMLRKMTSAPTGDDVYGDDPTVNALQEKAAAMSGKQAALFFPSGTQANLVALLSHCQRGDEYIAGQHAHNYRYEAGGAAVLGSIQPQPVMENADGTLPLDIVREVIKPGIFISPVPALSVSKIPIMAKCCPLTGWQTSLLSPVSIIWHYTLTGRVFSMRLSPAVSPWMR